MPTGGSTRFSRLEGYLRRYYPADHAMRLVHSASFPFTRPEIVDLRICDMGALAEVAMSQHISCVPPVKRQVCLP
jgi:hypothetical protein